MSLNHPIHPWYGPCDRQGEYDSCSECVRVVSDLKAENSRMRHYGLQAIRLFSKPLPHLGAVNASLEMAFQPDLASSKGAVMQKLFVAFDRDGNFIAGIATTNEDAVRTSVDEWKERGLIVKELGSIQEFNRLASESSDEYVE